VYRLCFIAFGPIEQKILNFEVFMNYYELENYEVSSKILGIAQKLFARRGAQTLFCSIWTFSVKFFELLSFYESKIKLNYLLFKKNQNFCIAHPNTTKQSSYTLLCIELSICIKNASSCLQQSPCIHSIVKRY